MRIKVLEEKLTDLQNGVCPICEHDEGDFVTLSRFKPATIHLLICPKCWARFQVSPLPRYVLSAVYLDKLEMPEDEE